MLRTPVVLAFAALLAACGSETSGEIVTGEGETGEYTIDRASGETSASIETPDGTATMRSGANVPVDLPDGFSLYPGAKVITNTVVDHADNKGNMVTFETGDSPKKVAAYYRKQAEAAGIKVQIDATINGGSMIAGDDGKGLSFSINASETEGTTSAQLMIGRNLAN